MVSASVKLAILGTVCLLFLAGCGGNTTASPAPSPQSSVVSVVVSPSSATVQAGRVQQFAAKVSPSTANQAVTWSVSGQGCSGASCGAIDATGKYTAPATLSNPATVTVTATSVADSTKAATAAVAITAITSGGPFTPIGNMTTARAGHTATLLPNGKVLIAGGYDAGMPNHTLASAELYDPSTGKFTPTGSMTTARGQWQTATLLTNGKVLIAGGFDKSEQPLASAELYDPSTGMFTPTGSMASAEVWRPATLLADGRVFVAGAANAEIYDPATGTFTSIGAYTTLAWWGSATTLPDGRVLLTGCVDWAPGTATGRPGAKLFDPRTAAFSVANPPAVIDPGDCQGADAGWTATLLRNSTVLLVESGTYDIEPFYRELAQIFDPATGAFTTVTSPSTTHGDGFSAPVGLADGTVLITGGQLIGGDGSPGSDLYLPATGTFASAGNMTTGRHSHTATLLPDGRVLISGGFNIWPTATASAEIYKP